MQYRIASDENGHESIVVLGNFGPDNSFGSRIVARGGCENYDTIKQRLTQGTLGEQEFLSLSSPGEAINQKLKGLTERLRYGNGRIYLDGDEVTSSLGKAIVERLNTHDESWRALAAFAEKLADNPNPRSRELFYEWVHQHGLSITATGDVVGYKGVSETGHSLHEGYAIVDGKVIEHDVIPYEVGSVVEMPRSMVDTTDTNCSVGLHVGTHKYASGYAPRLLSVVVDPRDVVGGLNGTESWKFRCCRLTVVGIGPVEPYRTPVVDFTADDIDEEEPEDDEDDIEPEDDEDEDIDEVVANPADGTVVHLVVDGRRVVALWVCEANVWQLSSRVEVPGRGAARRASREQFVDLLKAIGPDEWTLMS